MTVRAILFLLAILVASPTLAEDYLPGTLENFAHTLLRFGAVDLTDDTLLDEYAMITDCNIVEHFYSNDFKWSQVRGFIRESVKLNANTFPSAYRYDADMQLDRYDFKDKNFRFTEKSAVQAVNTFNFNFVAKSGESLCNARDLKYFPTVYDIVIGSSVSIRGLPLAESDAKSLLQRLEVSNSNRIIHARFNMTVMHVDPLHKADINMGSQKYLQTTVENGRGMRLDARLDSVQFYEDPDMTKLIYSYTP